MWERLLVGVLITVVAVCEITDMICKKMRDCFSRRRKYKFDDDAN